MKIFKKLNFKSLLFVGFGYLLSPLCWWNDLIFNLPIAYGMGKVVSFFHPSLFVPAAIVAYWLSNLVGILLMQLGTVAAFQAESSAKNWKKELGLAGIFSTVYTLIIFLLIKFDFLKNSFLLSF